MGLGKKGDAADRCKTIAREWTFAHYAAPPIHLLRFIHLDTSYDESMSSMMNACWLSILTDSDSIVPGTALSREQQGSRLAGKQQIAVMEQAGHAVAISILRDPST